MKRLITASAVLLAVSACGPRVDVKAGLRVERVSTGWADAGPAAGRNKVVPLVSFTLRNISDQKLPSVQVNAVFHRNGQNGEWGTAYVMAAGSAGLTPGAEATVVAKSQLGYTGTDASGELLANSQFVDATVDVFAKYGSSQWTRVGEFPIQRTLMP
ncbi:MAG TPA: hypothetical protein VFA59_00620 [Vicinamibacterales bacterium]|nr:hypothetical protein [Vicinamibacterales bacterium]